MIQQMDPTAQRAGRQASGGENDGRTTLKEV